MENYKQKHHIFCDPINKFSFVGSQVFSRKHPLSLWASSMLGNLQALPKALFGKLRLICMIIHSNSCFSYLYYIFMIILANYTIIIDITFLIILYLFIYIRYYNRNTNISS